MNEETVTRVLDLENEALHIYEAAQCQAKQRLSEAEAQAALLLTQSQAATEQRVARQQAETATRIAVAHTQRMEQARAEAAALNASAAQLLDLAVQRLLQRVTGAE